MPSRQSRFLSIARTVGKTNGERLALLLMMIAMKMVEQAE